MEASTPETPLHDPSICVGQKPVARRPVEHCTLFLTTLAALPFLLHSGKLKCALALLPLTPQLYPSQNVGWVAVKLEYCSSLFHLLALPFV